MSIVFRIGAASLFVSLSGINFMRFSRNAFKGKDGLLHPLDGLRPSIELRRA